MEIVKLEAVIFDWNETLADKSKGKIFPWSERVLQHLLARGYKMGLISLAKTGDTREKRIANREIEIKGSGLKDYFTHVLVEEVKTPEQFVECMRQLNVRPESTLVVDDRTVRGIQIGNQLGCQTAWVQRGEYSGEVPNAETGEPTYRINSVEDLLAIL